jgi:hypothetical protein
MEWKAVVEESTKTWRVEVRIPMQSIASSGPTSGTPWRINFYRHDKANRAHLAWSPTFTETFHTPERFGWIEFVK